VVLVPLLGYVVGRRTSAATWTGAVVAAVGLYFLTVSERFTVSASDGLVMACAVGYAVHVLLVDRVVRFHGALDFAFLQYCVTAGLSLAVAAVCETPSSAALVAAAGPILYGGVASVGVAYTLQVLAQRDAHPSHAAVIMCLESPFAALGGWLLLGEVLTSRARVGCALMLAGMLLSQWTRLNPSRSSP